MKILSARTVCAALLLSAAPATAIAQSVPSNRSAIATGLAIPIELPREASFDRAPAIPSSGRAVLVDAASARLFMIEDGRVEDSMRVIVGKPSSATPVLKSVMYRATVNPYWHVPVDLGRTLIAPNVLEQGTEYLEQRGYQVVTDFTEDARVLPADSVDWEAVAEGRETVHVRQLPGPANSMGEIKFGFPNGEGIFLHDTPRKALFNEAERDLSSGCVRLEDAPRFARWLLGRDPTLTVDDPEQHVPLPAPVTIVITDLDSPAQVHLAALSVGD